MGTALKRSAVLIHPVQLTNTWCGGARGDEPVCRGMSNRSCAAPGAAHELSQAG